MFGLPREIDLTKIVSDHNTPMLNFMKFVDIKH